MSRGARPAGSTAAAVAAATLLCAALPASAAREQHVIVPGFEPFFLDVARRAAEVTPACGLPDIFVEKSRARFVYESEGAATLILLPPNSCEAPVFARGAGFCIEAQGGSRADGDRCGGAALVAALRQALTTTPARFAWEQVSAPPPRAAGKEPSRPTEQSEHGKTLASAAAFLRVPARQLTVLMPALLLALVLTALIVVASARRHDGGSRGPAPEFEGRERPSWVRRLGFSGLWRTTPRAGDSGDPARPLARDWPFVVCFSVLFAVAFAALHLPYLQPERLLCEKDQIVLLAGARSGQQWWASVGGARIGLAPTLSLFYPLFFRFSTNLHALFVLLVSIRVVSLLGLYHFLRNKLPLYTAELLALMFLVDSHHYYDYTAAFLANTHAEPFVIAISILLVQFHLSRNLLWWHLANIVTVFAVNFHAINGLLPLFCLAFALCHRALFTRRHLLVAVAPYAALVGLYLDKFGADLWTVAAPQSDHAIEARDAARAALTSLAEHSVLGYLAPLGLLFAARAAFSRRSNRTVQALAFVALATAVWLAAAYALAGPIIMSGGGGHRLVALFPGLVLVAFLAIFGLVRLPGSPKVRDLLVAAALVVTPLHAEHDPDRTLSNGASRQIFRLVDAERLVEKLRAAGFEAEDLRRTLHVTGLHREIQFLSEIVQTEPEAQQEPRGHTVVRLLSRRLAHELVRVPPCLAYDDLRSRDSSTVDCRGGSNVAARYLYVIGNARRPPALIVGGERYAMVAARELGYAFFDNMHVYRTDEPVTWLEHRGDRVVLDADCTDCVLVDVFESPVLLEDHVEP